MPQAKSTMKRTNLKILFILVFALLPIFTLTNYLSSQEIWVKVKGIVNPVELEEYVCGVLAGEISSSWSLEALKAMAVCARTFAANKVMTNFNNDYHLTSGVRDQIYNGFSRNEFFARAVTETRGEVLTYDGNLAQVYYCASSGGYTASSASVWGSDFPYLKALADPYSTEDKYSSWTLILNSAEFLGKLKLSGTLKSVEVLKRDESNRVQELKISLQGKDYKKTGRMLRDTLGNNKLRSTLLEVRMENGKVIFTGRGWGHGVGLSQWGAKKMAEQGYTYDQILKFYFPGTIMGEIVTSQ